MEEHRVAIRILGVAPTSHGFAYAVTEGPERIIRSGRIAYKGLPTTHLETLLDTSRPLFVAVEMERMVRGTKKERCLGTLLRALCAERNLMILSVERHGTATNADLAVAAAERFPILGTPPKQRRTWQGRNDSIGVFVAASLSAAGWDHFKRSRPGRTELPG